MRIFKNIIAIALCLAPLAIANAHHSFAVYDTENPTEITGVLTSMKFRYPHILFEVTVANDDDTESVWVLDTMHPSLWDEKGFSREIAVVGEPVSFLGWAGRGGVTKMLVGTLTYNGIETVILDQIRK